MARIWILGGGLILAVVVQVRFGLQPLFALRREVASVRRGTLSAPNPSCGRRKPCPPYGVALRRDASGALIVGEVTYHERPCASAAQSAGARPRRVHRGIRKKNKSAARAALRMKMDVG